MGVGGQRHASAAYNPWTDLVPIVQEAGWTQGPVWTGAVYLAPTGFDPRTDQPVGSRYIDYVTRPTPSLGKQDVLKFGSIHFLSCFQYYETLDQTSKKTHEGSY